MVIEGEGFFQVLLPDGTVAYTRDGAFKMDGQGKLVTSDGFTLEPEILVPSNTVTVSVGADGTVTAVLDGESEPQNLGSIELVRFVNPAGLQSFGRNLMLATAASGEPILGTPGLEGFGAIAQGYLEISNVVVVEEMVNMISPSGLRDQLQSHPSLR